MRMHTSAKQQERTARHIWRWLGSLLLLVASPATALEVVVEGLPPALRESVLAELSIEQQKTDEDLSPTAMRALHARAAQEIRTALEPRGYYRATVQATLERREQDWHAHYRVAIGPALRITSLDLRVTGAGLNDPPFAEFMTKFPLHQGAVFDHEQYEVAKQRLLTLGADRGYFDAVLNRHTVEIDLNVYTANVALHYDTGPRYRFGGVEFAPGSGIELELLERYVPFFPGQPFDNQEILELRRGLVDADYFSRIDITPRRDLAVGNEVPILVTLEPRLPNKYNLGLGYGTDTGVRGKARWERRPINEAGHRLLTELNASQVRSDLTARYRIPVGNPRTDEVSWYAGVIAEYPETSRSVRNLVGVAYTHAGGQWRLAEGRIAGWNTSYTIDHERENWETGSESGRSILTMPGVRWLYLNTDSRLVPSHGWRTQLSGRGASNNFASDVSFTQARADGKLIYSLGRGGRFIVRAEIGGTWTEDFSVLPSSVRFYAGGDVSVRGYKYNSLGPTDPTGEVIGGPYLLTGSLEYEQHLYGNWGTAVFVDHGNALNAFSDPLKRGAGVGVRWFSPVGLIRFDIAWALSLDDRPWRIHVVIGPDL